MNVLKINFTKPTFGIKFGPKLEDEINLKRLHIKSLPNSKRHISLNEFEKIIKEIRKLFSQKNGSPTTVEIVERLRPIRVFDGFEYIDCGYNTVPGYKITNDKKDFRYFFNRENDGKEYFDRYKILLNTLKKLEIQDIKTKKTPFVYCYLNPREIERKLFDTNYDENY